MNSLWTQTAILPTFPPLAQNLKTDVLIIGGGITGILCAYMLEQAGADYALVESNTICSGITKNTTAKITAQHGLIYHKLLAKFGPERTQMYLHANQQALNRYRALCQHIDCEFQPQPSAVYSLSSRRNIDQELEALQNIGFSAADLSDLPLPFAIQGAVGFDGQAQFHPLKFLGAISKGLRIFEHTKVLELSPQRVTTNRGSISAKQILVATHFPFLNKHGSYFLKLYQHRSYVLALRNAAAVEGMYVDESETGLSFRPSGDLLLLGGGGHRTGKTGGNWKELTQFVKRHYPDSQELLRWATQDCMTLDGVPYIGQYSKRTPNLYVATGFNKWGMTSAMVSAMILTDLVQGKVSPYGAVFSPSRTMLRPQLALNAMESTIHLLTPTVPRCPHMGCALKYNPQERSWDCPCHGSRFTETGHLIDNPATDDRKE